MAGILIKLLVNLCETQSGENDWSKNPYLLLTWFVGFFAFLIYFKLKYLYYFILFYKMSLNIDNQNIEEDKNILTITEFKKNKKITYG